MEDFEYDVGGAPVIYTNKKAPPFNPLYRQKPNYRKMLLALILFLLISAAAAWFAARFLRVHWLASVAVCAALYICIFGKRSAIWLVRFYQYKAPDRVRLKCVFYPSCSEYMILSIQKYGLIRGVFCGIRRLLRCHPPNGGEDFP